jgi:hypothetical protein
VYRELKVPSSETMTIEDRFPVDAGRGGEFLVRVHSKEIPRRVSVESPQGETPEPNAVSSEGGIRAPVLQTIKVQRWPTTSVSFLRFHHFATVFPINYTLFSFFSLHWIFFFSFLKPILFFL